MSVDVDDLLLAGSAAIEEDLRNNYHDLFMDVKNPCGR